MINKVQLLQKLVDTGIKLNPKKGFKLSKKDVEALLGKKLVANKAEEFRKITETSKDEAKLEKDVEATKKGAAREKATADYLSNALEHINSEDEALTDLIGIGWTKDQARHLLTAWWARSNPHKIMQTNEMIKWVKDNIKCNGAGCKACDGKDTSFLNWLDFNKPTTIENLDNDVKDLDTGPAKKEEKEIAASILRSKIKTELRKDLPKLIAKFNKETRSKYKPKNLDRLLSRCVKKKTIKSKTNE